jgi:hypothetical protein
VTAHASPAPRFLVMQTSQLLVDMPLNHSATSLHRSVGRFGETDVATGATGRRTVYEVRDGNGRCTARVSYGRSR